MFTWELTTAFDGTISESELRKRFDDEFAGLLAEPHSDFVFFWPLVSFNASDGRKHRYLVVKSRESLEKYRQKFERCLPQQVALYAIADKILRGERDSGLTCEDKSASGNAAAVDCACSNGNLMLVALWKNCLYILVFVKGRLCHWSEELGYGESFDERATERVARFKAFMKADEMFAGEEAFGESYVDCDESVNMETLFQIGAKDPFWRGLDLDQSESMKPCKKRRWAMSAAMLLMLGLALALFSDDSWVMRNIRGLYGNAAPENDVPPVELSSPAARDLELLAWAEGHRDLLPAKWAHGDGFAEGANMFGTRRSWNACDSLDYKLLGIVGGRVALLKTAAGESKTVSVGDSVLRYHVTKIGMNEVVLRCGRKEVRYEVGTR